jgi:hypothetical protein
MRNSEIARNTPIISLSCDNIETRQEGHRAGESYN